MKNVTEDKQFSLKIQILTMFIILNTNNNSSPKNGYTSIILSYVFFSSNFVKKCDPPKRFYYNISQLKINLLKENNSYVNYNCVLIILLPYCIRIEV